VTATENQDQAEHENWKNTLHGLFDLLPRIHEVFLADLQGAGTEIVAVHGTQGAPGIGIDAVLAKIKDSIISSYSILQAQLTNL
jgi:hypothetical protein